MTDDDDNDFYYGINFMLFNVNCNILTQHISDMYLTVQNCKCMTLHVYALYYII